MATYYVRTDGNDLNTGTGPASNQAWQTVTKAIGATGIASGDTLYVAPGTYRSSTGFTIATAYTSATQILADPTAGQFSGIPAGPVRLSVYTPTDTSAGTSSTVLSGTTNNLLIEGFEIYAFTGSGINITATQNTVISKCVCFGSTAASTIGIQITPGGANTTGTKNQVRNCIVVGFFAGINIFAPTGSSLNTNCDIYDNLCVSQLAGGGIGINNNFVTGTAVFAGTTNIYNNTIIGCNNIAIFSAVSASPGMTNVTNNLIMNCGVGMRAWTSAFITATYNRVINCTSNVFNVTFGATNSSSGIAGIDAGQGLLHNLTSLQFGGSFLGSPNTAFGTTGLTGSDLYNVAWTGATPDAGAITYRSLATLTPTYQPTERNASTITIAPGSTSQSIELYLGATGLTASTSGLSARYNRTRTASVSIPLVARTIAQAWTSGGFAEVDATNMPGVYRLDLPDAALAAGADDVTIVVRGASGTNGAVMTINLKSAGLSEAQTAGAVWNAARASYATVGSFGEYVNADLVSQPGVSVHMGPFEVKADGLGASDPLDIQKGAQHGVDIQCVDGNGNGIDITSATVTAKVYNSGGSLVDTYSCTATYAADGRATFTIDTTVTGTAGTYTATITRTTGASDTQIFGPLRIYVRDI